MEREGNGELLHNRCGVSIRDDEKVAAIGVVNVFNVTEVYT